MPSFAQRHYGNQERARISVSQPRAYPPPVRLSRPTIPLWLLAGTAVLPIFVWWLGWYPGFASSDTIDQFGQIADGVYTNIHPAIHTLYLDVLSQGGIRPGLVTLFQLLVLGVLLAYAARWLVAAGVPTWLAVAVAWALGLSPAVAPTTLALWKDVPFSLLMLWAWIELLALAVDPQRSKRPWPAVRLGLALGSVWLFRGNGPLTVIVVVGALAWVYRRRLRFPAIVVGTSALIVFLIVGPLYAVVDVQGSGVEPAQVFLPDVAASYHSEPEQFPDSNIELMEALAPLSIWTSKYDCYESSPLLFDPQFDHGPIRQSPGDYLRLEIDVIWRDLNSVVRHHVCAANFVYAPAQPADAYFHRPPYEIPPNTLGLTHEPRSELAFKATDRIWRWAETDGRLWLTWRPAILLLPALAAVVVFAVRPRGRRFLLPSVILVAHTLNVAATSPSQEFRYAFPLYLMSALTLTLLWPTLQTAPSIEPESLSGDRADV